MYLSSGKCRYGGTMDWKFWYNIEFWCLYYRKNVLKQCIFKSTIMFYFVLELPATSDQLQNNSFNVYFILWFPVVYLSNAAIDFDGNFLKAAKCFAASRQPFSGNRLLHTPRSNVNSGACFDPLVNKGHEPGSAYTTGRPGHAACTCCGEVWHILIG